MDRVIKLGTRDSPLAMWQATKVKDMLDEQGIRCEIFAVKSEGDLDLVTPLYAMGVQGVFTKTLDAHLLSGRIDIAVHSMKDVPVQLAHGLVCGAVLERGPSHDVIVWKDQHMTHDALISSNVIVGTGSIRRRSQWLHRYPQHKVDNLRGNLQTRLHKLEVSSWTGAVFAAAGLDRMQFLNLPVSPLDWMIPAPAQGAIMVACREDDEDTFEKISALNHLHTALCVREERAFLQALHGGCSAPIGALMQYDSAFNKTTFKGCVSSIDGDQYYTIEDSVSGNGEGIGLAMAEKIGDMGASNVIQEIRGT